MLHKTLRNKRKQRINRQLAVNTWILMQKNSVIIQILKKTVPDIN